MNKQMRDMYFQMLSQSAEQYMRSPPFLEMIKQSTDTVVMLRQQANDFLADAHHAVGSLARPDLDSLLMAVRRCETRILDRLDEVSNQVSALESRLGVLESATNGRATRKAK